MNVLNVFKLYYIGWHQANKTREYSEFGCLKDNLSSYESILLKSDIEPYISNFNYSMYLDIWEKVCTKKREYFLAKVRENMSNIIEDAANMLYYLSSEDISDYYSYIGADFDYEEDSIEPSETKKYKNLLLIAKRLDIVLYNDLLKEIKEKLSKRQKNIVVLKDLWNTFEVDEIGKLHPTEQSYLQLENILSNNPEFIKENESELNEFYNTLLYSSLNSGDIAFRKI